METHEENEEFIDDKNQYEDDSDIFGLSQWKDDGDSDDFDFLGL